MTVSSPVTAIGRAEALAMAKVPARECGERVRHVGLWRTTRK
jgi:hypothetical protein